MQIPSTWQAIFAEEYVRLYFGSITEEQKNALSNAFWAAHVKFDANGYPLASVVVERLPNNTFTQKFVRSASKEFLEKLDAVVKQALVRGLATYGNAMQDWNGNRKIYIDGWVVLRNDYKTVETGTTVTKNIFRVFSEKKSFVVTVSFLENQNPDMRPQIDKIIESIRLDPIAGASEDNSIPQTKHAWFSTLSKRQQQIYGALYYIVGGLVGGFPAVFIRRTARRQFSRMSSIMLGIWFGIFTIILAEIMLPYTLQHPPLAGMVLGASYVILRWSNSSDDDRPSKEQDS